jgi:prolyl-tRNA synthetase
MLQSKLFYKTSREAPKDAESKSHIFLVRAGFIDQLSAGSYTFLPLGLLVLKKIESIIREEMNLAGGQEILMPALTPKENWQKTERWETLDVLFRLKGRNEKEYALAPTHEEIVSPLAKKFVFSYKDFPVYLFQIQTKFRDELRAKSGLLRTREFLMKDLYSFHATEEDLNKYYEKIAKIYSKIFKKCGINSYKTLASGGTFSKYSHEYQALTEAGEDIVYICQKCKLGINKEIKESFKACPDCNSPNFEERKAIEVGNIFKLGDKYSLPFDLRFKDKSGEEKPVLMGCYGIGLGRLMAAVVEENFDEKGIIWPKEISPFNIHLIKIENDKKIDKTAEKLYLDLQKTGLEVLYDDRKDVSAGQKLAEADLIGISTRVIISKRTLEKNSVEVKERAKSKMNIIKIKDLLKNA